MELKNRGMQGTSGTIDLYRLAEECVKAIRPCMHLKLFCICVELTRKRVFYSGFVSTENGQCFG